MKKIILVLLIGMLVFAGCTSTKTDDTKGNITIDKPPTTETPPANNKTTQPNLQNQEDKFILTEKICKSAGGNWNECGSACRNDSEATICTMQCVQYCECGGIAGFDCPQGYYCTDYMPKNAKDAMGVCKLREVKYDLKTEFIYVNVTNNKTETEKNKEGLKLDNYIFALDDLKQINNNLCAVLDIYSKQMNRLNQFTLCPNKNEYWTSPNENEYKFVLEKTGVNQSNNSITAEIVVYGG